MLVRSFAAFVVMVMLGCGSSGTSGACEGLNAASCGEPTSALVVDVEWLEAHLGAPDLQLIDTRASGFADARIPGAIQLRPGDLATTAQGVSSQAAPAVEAQQAMRAAGLRNEVTAVVYGAPPEYDPSRVVWSLRYYGHEDVRYLDGGYAAWVAGGGALDTDPPSAEPSEYTIVGVDEAQRVTGDWVLTQLGDAPYLMPAIQLVDARSPSEYDAGHIPTAASGNWTQNLNGGFLLSRTELEALYQGMDPAATTVTYCVSGWRGSFAWLTLTALGYGDVRLYDGSWNEWGNGSFPVEQ